MECPLLGRPSTLARHRSSSISVDVPLSPPRLPHPRLFDGSPSSSSVHSGALLLCLSPLASLRDTWIVGSHLPHYHTNSPLAHSDTAFILCPSHLRLAGDQPKCDLVHDRPFERAGCRSYELAREPLAWGTRRKSIILNHGVIGSNDQTTARRIRFTPRRFARTCHVASVYVKKGRFCFYRLRGFHWQTVIN